MRFRVVAEQLCRLMQQCAEALPTMFIFIIAGPTREPRQQTSARDALSFLVQKRMTQLKQLVKGNGSVRPVEHD